MHFAQIVDVLSAQTFQFRCEDTDEVLTAAVSPYDVYLFAPYAEAWRASQADPIGVVPPNIPVEKHSGSWYFEPTEDDFS